MMVLIITLHACAKGEVISSVIVVVAMVTNKNGRTIDDAHRPYQNI